MKILYGYRKIKGRLRNPVIAMGIFDGIHIGHRKVLRGLLRRPRALGDRAVMTFHPHPQEVVNPGRKPRRIMSLEHRLAIFNRMGVDAVVVIRFTPAIAGMSPEEFIRKVLAKTGASRVYVGKDFSFGRGRSGDIGAFKRIARDYGIDVRTVKPIEKGGRKISSTWLRELISSGDLEKAGYLLKRPVSVLGTVVKGDSRGRQFGIPTANIDPHHEVIPPPGVYAVKVGMDDGLHNGVLNIGFKPTFYGKDARREEPHIEVHILDFTGDIYGRTIEVFFFKLLRRERPFRDEAALRRQIDRDIKKSRALLSAGRSRRRDHIEQNRFDARLCI